MNHGISSLQPVHQVAQKSNNTTLPFNADSLTVAPEASFRTKSGAGFLSAGQETSAERSDEQDTTRAATTIAPFDLDVIIFLSPFPHGSRKPRRQRLYSRHLTTTICGRMVSA